LVWVVGPWGLTLQVPPHPDDAVVVEVKTPKPRELREPLQDEDGVIGEVYAVELVLRHTGGTESEGGLGF
jgi:hypothetical protein